MHLKFASADVISDSALGRRQIRVIANSGKRDRAGDRLVASGAKLDKYRLNPIVLADHNPSAPIGNFAPEVKDGAVQGVITFAPAGISPKADEYCGLYKAGVMKTVSVGFKPIEYEPIKGAEGGGCLFKRWELMELSCVTVPCDADALVVARSIVNRTGARADTMAAEVDREKRIRQAKALAAAGSPFSAVPENFKIIDPRRQVVATIAHIGPTMRGEKWRSFDPNRGHVADYLKYGPAVLFEHKSPPIAWCIDVRRGSDSMHAVAQFPPIGLSSLSDEIFRQVESGVVAGASIGSAWLKDDAAMNGGVLEIRDWELREWSLVRSPAHPLARIVSVGGKTLWGSSSSGLSLAEAGYVSGAHFVQAWRDREERRLAARWTR
jgi:HK97 family phage prohead protease